MENGHVKLNNNGTTACLRLQVDFVEISLQFYLKASDLPDVLDSI